MKDYLLFVCEESYKCDPDRIGLELWIGGIVVAILIILYIGNHVIKRFRNE